MISIFDKVMGCFVSANIFTNVLAPIRHVLTTSNIIFILCYMQDQKLHQVIFNSTPFPAIWLNLLRNDKGLK